MRTRTWNIIHLKNAVNTCTSYRQVLTKLGLREAGGNYSQIKKYIKEYKLSIKHFKGQGWKKGLSGLDLPRIPLEKILIKNSNFQSYKLKKRLFAAGLKTARCEECGWKKISVDGRLPLELDHINGNSQDNRIENLRILCPNCHSLKPTHRGRNIKKITG